MTIINKAKKIAKIFLETDIEDRGVLMVAIASELKKSGQGYTSNLLEKIGRIYNGEG